MDSWLMPEDFEPPVRRPGGSGGEAGELLKARDEARANPGRWVRVGPARFLKKPPTSWTSEVRGGAKAVLQREGDSWDANYQETGQVNEGGDKEYLKVIKVVPIE